MRATLSPSSKDKDKSFSGVVTTPGVAPSPRQLSVKELKAISKAEKAHSRKLDAMLAEQSAQEKKVVKILLLGPGESGKYVQLANTIHAESSQVVILMQVLLCAAASHL